MHDAAVVARLRAADLVGGVEDDEPQPRPPGEQLAGGCKAEDAGTDDGDVVALHWPEASLRDVNVLVTGASGAVGADLVPRLARAGHGVRALARDPARVVAEGVGEVVRGDAVTGAGLDAALDGIDVAYYLIHSMEAGANGDGAFAERERRAAERFAAAARAAGVRRVVYLGGLVPERAPAVARTWPAAWRSSELLLDAAPEAIALRASIVIGARSRSFRFLVRLVERVPVMPLPAWREHRTRPIDARDVIA